MTDLELIIEEISEGFHFTDHLVDIKLVKNDSYYTLIWTDIEQKTASETINKPEIKTIEAAYREFKENILDYWTSPFFGPLFAAANWDKIECYFKELDEKYLK